MAQSLLLKIRDNTLILFSRYVLGRILGMFLLYLMGHYLKPEWLGLYMVVGAYLTFFRLAALGEINQIVVREVSKDKIQGEILAGNAILIQCCGAILGIFAANLFAYVFSYTPDQRFLIFILSFDLLLTPVPLFFAGLTADLNQKPAALLDSFYRILATGVSGIILLMAPTQRWAVFGMIISNQVLSFALAPFKISVTRRFFKPKFKIDLQIWKNLLKDAWPLLFNGIFVIIYLRIDQLMLEKMIGPQSLGLYSVGVQFSEHFNIIPSIFFASIFPLLAKTQARTPIQYKEIYERSFKYLTSIILPIAVLFTTNTSEIISLFYDDAYLPARPAVILLMWAQLFVFGGTVHYQILISQNLQKIALWLTLVSALINILFNLILIPNYTFTGAAIASLIAYSFGFPIAFCIPKTRPYMKAFFMTLWRPTLAAGITLFFCTLFHPGLVMALITIPIIYLLGLKLMGVIDAQDMAMISRLIPQKVKG